MLSPNQDEAYLNKLKDDILKAKRRYEKERKRLHKRAVDTYVRSEIHQEGKVLALKWGFKNIHTGKSTNVSDSVYWLRFSMRKQSWSWSMSLGLTLQPITVATRKEANELRDRLNKEDWKVELSND